MNRIVAVAPCKTNGKGVKVFRKLPIPIADRCDEIEWLASHKIIDPEINDRNGRKFVSTLVIEENSEYIMVREGYTYEL